MEAASVAELASVSVSRYVSGWERVQAHSQGAQLGHVVEAGDGNAADVVVVQRSGETEKE